MTTPRNTPDYVGAQYEILPGDCLETMRSLPSGIVQTCVTSPPYFGLRSYLHNEHDDKHLEIGTEETPEAYVAKLVEVFREVRRVMRDDGTLWLNLGDSYNGSGGAGGDYGVGGLKEGQPKYPGRNVNGLGPKQLLGIPWRVAFALQADGWILRSDIIWHKPNPMPESVSDRPTKSHEYIFLLSKSREYFYDADAIREEYAPLSGGSYKSYMSRGLKATGNAETCKKEKPHAGFGINVAAGGRNKRSVWTVTTKPYKFAHFATFPEALIEPCILAGSSSYGACAKCGAPWARVVERQLMNTDGWGKATKDHTGNISGSNASIRNGNGRLGDSVATTLGWAATCTCNADVAPCLVLDPFSGSGTVGAVALKHGRKYIGCELNEDYITLAHRRIQQSQPMLLLEGV